jgi:cell division protein ZipA
MDKELLRVIIIAIGLLVVIGMLAWSYLSNRNVEPADGLFDNPNLKRKPQADKKESSKPAAATKDELDEFDIVPKKAASFDEEIATGDMFEDMQFEDHIDYADDEDDTAPRFVVPEIIQFSVVSKATEGFNGLDLLNAFNIVGLEYGSLKIFERLDPNRLVDFGVASMAKPGTFPDEDMESYFCPGVVFFMQPNVLDNPQVVFDDFIDTMRLLAVELSGEILDHERNPLTNETVELFRQSL